MAALFQACLVQGMAWRSVTLQDVRQNPSLAPRMGTEFGCTVCRHLRAASIKPKSLQTSVSKEVPGLSLFWSAFRGGPLWCTRFRRVFRSRKWAREIGQKPGEDVVWQRNAGRRQPPPQAHFISPNPPRHSRKSVSDGVIQLRVPLAGCAGFFLQAPIPRRILTKMSEAICCMNMRFAKRSWEHPCF